MKSRGFTLIEIMIVVVIIGLLAAIAFPSYQNQIRKSRRSDGHIALTNIAQRLERCYTVNGAYNVAAGCDALSAADTLTTGLATSPEGNYSISIANTATTYTLTATPAGALASMGDPGCGNLSLNHQGQRGVSGTDSVADCW